MTEKNPMQKNLNPVALTHCKHIKGILVTGKNVLEKRVCLSMDIESRKCWGQQGPLVILSFNPLLKARSGRSGCSRPYPDVFWIVPKFQTPKILWENSEIEWKDYLLLPAGSSVSSAPDKIAGPLCLDSTIHSIIEAIKESLDYRIIKS